MGRVGLVSLGCPKALVDSERIVNELRADGYRLVGSYEEAELVVVNTCGFITPAIDESLAAIGEALERNGRVVVTGCLGARPEEIMGRHPRVLAVTGPADLAGVLGAVRQALPLEEPAFAGLRPLAADARGAPLERAIRLTPRHYAYLKVAEGCDHACSFCVIPRLRGRQVSRDAADVLHEAARLVATGTRELIVIAQDTGAYGRDLLRRTSLYRGRPVAAEPLALLRELAELGVWVRLHYLYPDPSVSELVALMAERRLLPYLDVPLQHASPRLLRAMRRPGGVDGHLALLRSWRRACPDLAIRSSFIVGFPGETEADVEVLIEFLREARLDRVGAFTYSAVPGAAANGLPGAVPEEVKRARHARVMEAQREVAEELQRAKIGRVLPVIVDEAGPLPGEMTGRSPADAPDVDGRVLLATDGTVAIGDLVEARVTDADAYDLRADVVGRIAWRPRVPCWDRSADADRAPVTRGRGPSAAPTARTRPR